MAITGMHLSDTKLHCLLAAVQGMIIPVDIDTLVCLQQLLPPQCQPPPLLLLPRPLLLPPPPTLPLYRMPTQTEHVLRGQRLQVCFWAPGQRGS